MNDKYVRVDQKFGVKPTEVLVIEYQWKQNTFQEFKQSWLKALKQKHSSSKGVWRYLTVCLCVYNDDYDDDDSGNDNESNGMKWI